MILNFSPANPLNFFSLMHYLCHQMLRNYIQYLIGLSFMVFVAIDHKGI
uniref:Uncharacterized protein n=1 Tax=Manihot esculenta TaxID=3983 RepID=A0A2C9VFX4_MANES